MKWPEATISARRCTEIVIKLIFGSLNPRARKASDTIRFGQLPGVPRIQGSLTSSARSILATPGPLAAHSGHHNDGVVEKNFHVQIIKQLIVRSREREVS